MTSIVEFLAMTLLSSCYGKNGRGLHCHEGKLRQIKKELGMKLIVQRGHLYLVMLITIITVSNLESAGIENKEETLMSQPFTNNCPFEVIVKILPTVAQNIETRCGLLISVLRHSGARDRLSENGPNQLLKRFGLNQAEINDEIAVLYRQIVGLMREGISKDEIIKDLLQSYSTKDKLDRNTMITHLVIHGTYNDRDVDNETIISKLMSVKEKEAYSIICLYHKAILYREASDFLKNVTSNEIAQVFCMTNNFCKIEKKAEVVFCCRTNDVNCTK